MTGVTASPTWALTQNEIQKLLASDGAAGDDFGRSVSVDGNTAVIGALTDDDPGTDSGSAYVFSLIPSPQQLLRRSTDSRWFANVVNYNDATITIEAKGFLDLTRNTAYQTVSRSDFNGDGSADALLRRGDGRWFLYTLNSLTIGSQGSLTMTRNTAFQIVSAEDFSGDSMADILMRRTNGRWVLYAIDGNGPSILKQGVPDMTRNEDWLPQTD